MTTTSGKPLRALFVIILCWTAGRVAAALPWHEQTLAWAADHKPTPRAVFAIAASPGAMPSTQAGFASGHADTIPTRPDPGHAMFDEMFDGGAGLTAAFARAAASPAFGAPSPLYSGSQMPPSSFIKPTGQTASDRWSLDSWLLWRDGGPDGSLSSNGQLGASQAGVRLLYDLTPRSTAHLSAYARLTSALGSPTAPEAGMGFAYQPNRSVPLSFAIERRMSLGTGARNAFAIMAITGFGPVDIPLGFTSEAYAQAGIVGFRNRDAFIDGRLTVLRPLYGNRLGAGFSVSGGVQPYLGRLDIGPAIEAKLTIGKKSSRMAAEWRQRVIGRARPGSGPAVTIVAGF